MINERNSFKQNVEVNKAKPCRVPLPPVHEWVNLTCLSKRWMFLKALKSAIEEAVNSPWEPNSKCNVWSVCGYSDWCCINSPRWMYLQFSQHRPQRSTISTWKNNPDTWETAIQNILTKEWKFPFMKSIRKPTLLFTQYLQRGLKMDVFSKKNSSKKYL